MGLALLIVMKKDNNCMGFVFDKLQKENYSNTDTQLHRTGVHDEAFKKRGQTGRRRDITDVTVAEMANHILTTMLDNKVAKIVERELTA
jgi:hypothetical protein